MPIKNTPPQVNKANRNAKMQEKMREFKSDKASSSASRKAPRVSNESVNRARSSSGIKKILGK